jgi:CheY-like chemotaxis protein
MEEACGRPNSFLPRREIQHIVCPMSLTESRSSAPGFSVLFANLDSNADSALSGPSCLLTIDNRIKCVSELPFDKVIDNLPVNVAEVPPTRHRPREASTSFSISGVENQVKPKVLIVDDEDFFRKMIVMGFEREGFSVFQADNGEDAVNIAQKELPDLILLDLVMPRLLGFEVCQALRNDEKFSKTAIIIMSAKSYKPDMDKAAELGADAYVVKPFELTDLMKTARENLHKRQNPK